MMMMLKQQHSALRRLGLLKEYVLTKSERQLCNLLSSEAESVKFQEKTFVQVVS